MFIELLIERYFNIDLPIKPVPPIIKRFLGFIEYLK
jgi:hypothetical protein